MPSKKVVLNKLRQILKGESLLLINLLIVKVER